MASVDGQPIAAITGDEFLARTTGFYTFKPWDERHDDLGVVRIPRRPV